MLERFVNVLYTDLRGQLGAVERVRLGADGNPIEPIRISGSMQPGWETARDSELQLTPDRSNGLQAATVGDHLFADVVKRVGEVYPNDPRATLRRAVERACAAFGADAFRVGFESEFYVFRKVHYETSPQGSRVRIEPCEGHGNQSDRSGHYFCHGSQHAMLSPVDKTGVLRADLMDRLAAHGIEPAEVVHECGVGQLEVSLRAASPVAAVDRLQLCKALVRRFVVERGLTATFMPKPLAWDFGSGLHINVSAWKGGRNLFFSAPDRLSDPALHFVAGVLRHARQLNCITNPWTNSYRRLISAFHYDRPPDVGFGDRTAAIRIPGFSCEEECRVEIRFPDNAANPYLALGGVLQAAVAGLTGGLAPAAASRSPALPPASVPSFDPLRLCADRMAASVLEAIEALRNDSRFLSGGEVFHPSLVDALLKDVSYFAGWSQQVPTAEDYQIVFSL